MSNINAPLQLDIPTGNRDCGNMSTFELMIRLNCQCCQNSEPSHQGDRPMTETDELYKDQAIRYIEDCTTQSCSSDFTSSHYSTSPFSTFAKSVHLYQGIMQSPTLLSIFVPEKVLKVKAGIEMGIRELELSLKKMLPLIHPALQATIPYGLIQCYDDRGIHQSTTHNFANLILLRVPDGENDKESDMYDRLVQHLYPMKVAGTVNTADQLDNISRNNKHERILKSRLALTLKILDKVNGEGMICDPTAGIKILPLSRLSFISSICDSCEDRQKNSVNSINERMNKYSIESTPTMSSSALSIESQRCEQSKIDPITTDTQPPLQRSELPLCPVCLYRIEPNRLGLPEPKDKQRCSQYCAINEEEGDTGSSKTADENSRDKYYDNTGFCRNMKFLSPWSYPFYCLACHIIHERLTQSGAQPYWRHDSSNLTAFKSGDETTANTLTPLLNIRERLHCFKCGMKETLWICLTCGTVGCGRYSQAHAERHFHNSFHPYSLELATQRIWDYATSSFVQRKDLLNCPLMQQLLGEINRAAYHGAAVMNDECCGMAHLKGGSPKKATMIGEEYEVLIQSALEDQAQHFEGKLSHLRAELTAQSVDEGKMTKNEIEEVEKLQQEIFHLRGQVDHVGKDLLKVQAEEAGHRAKSNLLLREQSIANNLFEKLKEELTRERKLGKLQVEDLEQQISDLNANLQMRQQISNDEELSEAQIVIASGNKSKKKKSYRRSNRK